MNLKPLKEDLEGYRKFRGYLFFRSVMLQTHLGWVLDVGIKIYYYIITIITTCLSAVSVNPYKNVPRW